MDKKAQTHNKGFCNIGADGITMNIYNSIWHLFGQTSFNLASCCYLHHQFFNLASVPGGRFSNSPTSQSPIVMRQLKRRYPKIYNLNQNILKNEKNNSIPHP